VFARKVDIDKQKATFKYELKSKLPVRNAISIHAIFSVLIKSICDEFSFSEHYTGISV